MSGPSGTTNSRNRVSAQPSPEAVAARQQVVLAPGVAEAAALGVAVGTLGVPTANETNANPTSRVAPQTQAQSPAAATVGDSTPAGQTNIPQEVRYITTGAANNVLQGLLDDSRFLGNPLSEFHQVAYHWRLFALPDAATLSASLRNVAGLNQITIAESGVTAGYVIKDVQFDSVISPNYRSRNVNMTDITISIEEPLGVSFIDAMATACANLRVANPQRCIYGLELTFRAYSDGDAGTGGVPLTNPLSQTTNGGKWTWLITFQDIQTSLTSNGGSYVLKGKPYEEQVFDEARFLRVNETMNIPGGTVQQFLNNLARSMNEGWRNRYGTNSEATDIVNFTFKTHPVEYPRPMGDPGLFQLQPRQVETNTYRGLSMTGGSSPTAQIPSGTTITDIVDFMFANCEKAQELGLDRGNRQGQTDASQSRVNENGFRQSVIFRIEPEVEVIGYERVSNVYRLKVILHVRPYYTQAALLSETQPQNAEDPAVQRQMVEALDQRNFLKKRYEYLFTGRNTEVINLEIQYNMAWSAVLPRLEGARRSIEAVQNNARMHDANINPQYDRDATSLRVEAQAIERQISEGTQALRERERSINDLRNERNELTRQIARTGENDASVANARARVQAIDTSLASLEADQSSIRNNVAGLRARIAGPAMPTSDADIRNNAGQRQFAEDDPFFASSNRVRPVISFHQGNDETRNATGVGFHGGHTRDKALFGAVLEQLYAPVTGQFISIDMTVRGDPYWLGADNVTRQLEMREGAAQGGRQTGTSGLPNFIDGDQCFLLTFRYPLGIGDGQSGNGELSVSGRESNEGAPIFRNHDIFNGVYRVTKVSSSFMDGQFKQVLTAQVLPLIDIIKAFGFGARGVRMSGANAAELAGIVDNTTAVGPTALPADASQLPGASF